MADYTHRKRTDGTWNSIYMTCYHTAAKSGTEPELREIESMHRCYDSPQLQVTIQMADLLQRKAV
jgi:hypothetical protein